MLDVISVSYNWWRHKGDHHRHPIPLLLQCDQVTLCLYNDLVQIKGIAVVLSMVLQFCAWINSRIHGSKQGVTINIDIYIYICNWFNKLIYEPQKRIFTQFILVFCVWKFWFGHGKVMEKSWNFFLRFLWEPWTWYLLLLAKRKAEFVVVCWTHKIGLDISHCPIASKIASWTSGIGPHFLLS